MQTGELIKLFRTKKKLSQIEFAKKTGITPNYLSLIENGKRIPKTGYLKKVADILKVPVNLFMWEEIDLSKFKDSESKRLAKKIEKDITEVKKLVFRKLLES